MNLLLPALFALAHADAVMQPPPQPAALQVAAEEGGVRRVPIKKQPVDKEKGTPEPTQPRGKDVPALPPRAIPAPPSPSPAPPHRGGGANVPSGPDNSQCKRGTGQAGWDGCR